MILDRHKHILDTTANQFGYKPKHGTEFCIFVVKQVIDYYKSNGSPVYLCFLDLSKAFDRVDFSLLITKLMSRKFQALSFEYFKLGMLLSLLLSSGEIVGLHLLLLQMESVRVEFYLHTCSMFS